MSVLLIMVRKSGIRGITWWVMVVSIVIMCVYIGFELGKQWEGYKYIRVVDGDTIMVQSKRNGEETRLRVMGIDAPETRDCFGNEASLILQSLLYGKKLSYQIFGRDGFGRFLGIVYANNDDISEKMVAMGAATAYSAKDIHDDLKPDSSYFETLKRLEEESKGKKLGVWSSLCLR